MDCQHSLSEFKFCAILAISLAYASPLARGFKRANSTAPAVNVKESEKAYTMELAAPGIKKEYCRVAINDEGNLTIAIENKQEHKHEDKHHHYLRREFSYSNYEQSYTLPDDVVKDQISAKVEDGILTVTMPKTEPKQKVTKAIEVS